MASPIAKKIVDLINSAPRSPTADEIEAVIAEAAHGEPTCPICGVANPSAGTHRPGCIMIAERAAWDALQASKKPR